MLGGISFCCKPPSLTKESWTEEEFRAMSRKFFGANLEKWNIVVEDNLELFLNFEHELFRRDLEESRNSSQFTFAINDFNPSYIGGFAQTERHDATIFQQLANILEHREKA